jgi:hypothetical protein
MEILEAGMPTKRERERWNMGEKVGEWMDR